MSISESVRELPGRVAEMLPHASDIGAFGDGELTEFVRLVGQAAAVLQSSAAVAAAEVEARSRRELGAESLARKAGARSGADLVQKLTGSSLGDARKAVRVGVMLETAQAVAPVSDDLGSAEPTTRSLEVLAALPGDWATPVAVAIRNGWLSAEQGDKLTAGLGRPRDDASTPAFRRAVLRLVEDCWEGELTAEDVSRTAKALRACLDREWAQANAARLYEQRSLKRTVRGDGMVKYDLLVDPMTDAQLWTPIFRHLAPRLGGPRFMTDEERQQAAELEQDARSNEQLLCDTFTGFFTAGVATSGVFGKHTPTVTIAVTTRELKKAITADAARQSGAPPGGDGIGWLDGKPEPVTGPHLITAICDGAVGALLLDDTGQALDATKAERTFSLRQRRAMALRDGGCLMPGCPMPPDAAEAHHDNPWGERPENHKTETKDGICLCKFHHLNLHNHGGRIERRGSTYWLHWPGKEPIRLIPKHGLITQLRTDGELA